MSNPEWLTVGAKVACVSDRHGHAAHVKFTTIVKIGKRDIVLENGDRFNVNHLSKRVGGSWGRTIDLLPAKSPIVKDLVAKLNAKKVRDNARSKAGDFSYSRVGVSSYDVIRAIAPLTDIEDELIALLDARSAPATDTAED